MNAEFARTLSLLRQEKKVSQRTAATACGISQALLSHYENGVREPGLPFVVKVCDYYGVSADFLLGRTLSRDGTIITSEDLYDLSEEKDNTMRGSVLALLTKKLLINSIGMLFDLLGKTGNRTVISAAGDYIGTAITQVFRRLHSATPNTNADFFSLSARQFETGMGDMDRKYNEILLVESLAEHQKEPGNFPDLQHVVLSEAYPGLYQSMLQVLHNSGERTGKYSPDKWESDK